MRFFIHCLSMRQYCILLLVMERGRMMRSVVSYIYIIYIYMYICIYIYIYIYIYICIRVLQKKSFTLKLIYCQWKHSILFHDTTLSFMLFNWKLSWNSMKQVWKRHETVSVSASLYKTVYFHSPTDYLYYICTYIHTYILYIFVLLYQNIFWNTLNQN